MFLFLLLVILSFLDCVITYYLIKSGEGIEANPIINRLLRKAPVLGYFVKILVLIFCGIIYFLLPPAFIIPLFIYLCGFSAFVVCANARFLCKNNLKLLRKQKD